MHNLQRSKSTTYEGQKVRPPLQVMPGLGPHPRVIPMSTTLLSIRTAHPPLHRIMTTGTPEDSVVIRSGLEQVYTGRTCHQPKDTVLTVSMGLKHTESELYTGAQPNSNSWTIIKNTCCKCTRLRKTVYLFRLSHHRSSSPLIIEHHSTHV